MTDALNPWCFYVMTAYRVSMISIRWGAALQQFAAHAYYKLTHDKDRYDDFNLSDETAEALVQQLLTVLASNPRYAAFM